jgi:hypothetical protein
MGPTGKAFGRRSGRGSPEAEGVLRIRTEISSNFMHLHLKSFYKNWHS